MRCPCEPNDAPDGCRLESGSHVPGAGKLPWDVHLFPTVGRRCPTSDPVAPSLLRRILRAGRVGASARRRFPRRGGTEFQSGRSDLCPLPRQASDQDGQIPWKEISSRLDGLESSRGWRSVRWGWGSDWGGEAAACLGGPKRGFLSAARHGGDLHGPLQAGQFRGTTLGENSSRHEKGSAPPSRCVTRPGPTATPLALDDRSSWPDPLPLRLSSAQPKRCSFQTFASL